MLKLSVIIVLLSLLTISSSAHATSDKYERLDMTGKVTEGFIVDYATPEGTFLLIIKDKAGTHSVGCEKAQICVELLKALNNNNEVLNEKKAKKVLLKYKNKKLKFTFGKSEYEKEIGTYYNIVDDIEMSSH